MAFQLNIVTAIQINITAIQVHINIVGAVEIISLLSELSISVERIKPGCRVESYRNRQLEISRMLLESRTEGNSLFTSAASHQNRFLD